MQVVEYSSKDIRKLKDEIDEIKKRIAKEEQPTFTNVEEMFEYLENN